MTACTENVAQDNPFEMGWVRFGLKGPRGQVSPTDTMKKTSREKVHNLLDQEHGSLTIVIVAR